MVPATSFAWAKIGRVAAICLVRHLPPSVTRHPSPAQVKFLEDEGILNLYPVLQQLPWTDGIPDGAYAFLIFTAFNGKVCQASTSAIYAFVV